MRTPATKPSLPGALENLLSGEAKQISCGQSRLQGEPGLWEAEARRPFRAHWFWDSSAAPGHNR